MENNIATILNQFKTNNQKDGLLKVAWKCTDSLIEFTGILKVTGEKSNPEITQIRDDDQHTHPLISSGF